MTKPKRERVENRRNKRLEDKLVELMHDGLSFSQACRACRTPRETVTYWRDQDAELDERFRNATTLGMSRLNDDVLERYQAVIDGDNSWSKEQVAAMRDYSQHVRWLSSKLYPKQYGEKGMAQVAKAAGRIDHADLDDQRQRWRGAGFTRRRVVDRGRGRVSL